jgi:hypothetical protein
MDTLVTRSSRVHKFFSPKERSAQLGAIIRHPIQWLFSKQALFNIEQYPA